MVVVRWRKKRKVAESDYAKAIASCKERLTFAVDLEDAFKILRRWLADVPWWGMTPKGRKKFEKEVVKTLKEYIAEEFFKRNVKLARKRAPRWRPAYDRIAKFLVKNPDELEAITFMTPVNAYRYIASLTNLSWRTVRDAFWAFRYGGLRIW